MILHNSLVMSDSGVVHGLLDQEFIIRNDEDFGKTEERRKLPIEEKESFKWVSALRKAQQLCKDTPGTEMVYIADREADIMELFHQRQYEHMHYVIRSKYNRTLKDSSSKLYDILQQTPFAGCYAIKIIHPQTHKERTAYLQVRFIKQSITLNKYSATARKGLGPIDVNAIEVVEINPPADIEEPIHWILLTSLPESHRCPTNHTILCLTLAH